MRRSRIVHPDAIIYYLAYFIYSAGLILAFAAIESADTIQNILTIFSVLLLYVSFLVGVQRIYYVKKTWKILILSLMLLFVTLLAAITRNYFLIAVILFSACLRNLRVENLFAVSFASMLVMTVLILLLCCVGIAENRQYYPRFGVSRNTLGFLWPLNLPDILVYLCCYYYCFKRKMGIGWVVLAQIAGVVLYFFCGSRIGLLALEALLFAEVIWNIYKCDRRKKAVKILERISAFSYMFMAALSQILLWQYRSGSAVAISIDHMLSGRLNYTSRNFSVAPFRFVSFMSTAEFSSTYKYPYDNGYYYIIARWGYLLMLCFLVITYFSYLQLKKEENYPALIGFTIVAILNFIDNGLTSYGFLPFLLMGIYNFLHYFSYIKGKKL